MNFCRSSCIKIEDDNFSDNERKCLKNCSSKYIQQFKIFNNFKEEFEDKYSTRIFLFDDDKKLAIDKLADIIKLNEEI
jgi:hypothetical protein